MDQVLHVKAESERSPFLRMGALHRFYPEDAAASGTSTLMPRHHSTRRFMVYGPDVAVIAAGHLQVVHTLFDNPRDVMNSDAHFGGCRESGRACACGRRLMLQLVHVIGWPTGSSTRNPGGVS
jgi:hypothetical protein